MPRTMAPLLFERLTLRRGASRKWRNGATDAEADTARHPGRRRPGGRGPAFDHGPRARRRSAHIFEQRNRRQRPPLLRGGVARARGGRPGGRAPMGTTERLCPRPGTLGRLSRRPPLRRRPDGYPQPPPPPRPSPAPPPPPPTPPPT